MADTKNVTVKSPLLGKKTFGISTDQTVRYLINEYLDRLKLDYDVTGKLKDGDVVLDGTETIRELDKTAFIFEADFVRARLWSETYDFAVASFDKVKILAHRIAEKLELPVTVLDSFVIEEDPDGDGEFIGPQKVVFSEKIYTILGKTIALETPEIVGFFAKRALIALASVALLFNNPRYEAKPGDSEEERQEKKEDMERERERLRKGIVKKFREFDLIKFREDLEKNPPKAEALRDALYDDLGGPDRVPPAYQVPAMSFIVMEHRQNRGFRDDRSNAFMSNGQSSTAPGRIVGLVNSLEEARQLLGPGFPRQESRPFDKVTSSYCLYLDKDVQIRAYSL